VLELGGSRWISERAEEGGFAHAFRRNKYANQGFLRVLIKIPEVVNLFDQFVASVKSRRLENAIVEVAERRRFIIGFREKREGRIWCGEKSTT
jgi:hypothetical protein